jgi:hypothetical protein
MDVAPQQQQQQQQQQRRPLHAVLTRKRYDALASSLRDRGLDASTVATVLECVCAATNFHPEESTSAYSAWCMDKARRRAAEQGISVHSATHGGGASAPRR